MGTDVIPQVASVLDPQSYQSALIEFNKVHPNYAATTKLDTLRATEYARLDEQKQVYLDYTGGSLYADSQVHQHLQMLQKGVFGNPHSSNPTSHSMTELDEKARAYVLEFFHASADEYTVVFAQNASGALKLVGESYPFQPGSQYMLT